MLARLDQRDRRALASGAAGAADAVQVGLGRVRHVVVDDVRQVLDVEAARGDVGGDEQIRLAFAEPRHDAVALPLLHAAVQRLGAVAVRVQRLDQRVDLEPGAAEDERRRRRSRSRARARAPPPCAGAPRCRRPGGPAASCRPRSSRARSRSARDPSDAGSRSTGSAAASSPRTAPSGVPSASPRGSRRDPRRSPCRASRRPRRGRASAACRARACRGGCDRARAPAWRRRCWRRARARGSAGASARRRTAAARSASSRARTCGSPRRPASPARASAPAPGPTCADGRRRPPRRSRCSIGSANAAVLPVPVAACAEQVAARRAAAGWSSRWMGVGSS